jgi:hypothetical protein
MKVLYTLAVAFALAAACGCQSQTGATENTSRTDSWLVRSYSDEAVKNAVIAQHTLYPYHFVLNGDVLSPLGEHDLAILADHFKRYPGQLNIRRGDVGEDLHRRRVQTVVEVLKSSGVSLDGLTIVDMLPGGDGMNSERVAKVLSESPRSGGGEADQSSQTTSSSGD